jgi:hypothetical protein
MQSQPNRPHVLQPINREGVPEGSGLVILATSHGEIAVHRNWLDHPLFCAARYNQENGNWAFYRMVD